MERIYWTISSISLCCVVLLALTGCGGSSPEQDTQTKQDLATEAQERCHELNPTVIGPCKIADPVAYLAANGPVIGQ